MGGKSKFGWGKEQGVEVGSGGRRGQGRSISSLSSPSLPDLILCFVPFVFRRWKRADGEGRRGVGIIHRK